MCNFSLFFFKHITVTATFTSPVTQWTSDCLHAMLKRINGRLA